MNTISKKISKGLLRFLIEVGILLLIVVFVFMIFAFRNRFIIKKYDSIKLGISYNKLLDRIGEPEYLVKLKTGDKILYYKSPNMIADGKEIEKINNRIINFNEIVDAYAYFEYYFNEEDVLEAYTYHGEALNIKSIYGNIEGSSIVTFLEEKRRRQSLEGE